MFVIINDLNIVDSYSTEALDDLPENWSQIGLPDTFDARFDSYNVSNGQIERDFGLLNSNLIRERNTIREEKKRNFITGESKAFIYVMKFNEYHAYKKLTQQEKDSLSIEDLKEQFTFMYHDSNVFGDTVEDAFLRFRAGIESSVCNLAIIEAEFQYNKTNLIISDNFDEKQNSGDSFTNLEIEKPKIITEDGLILTTEDDIEINI